MRFDLYQEPPHELPVETRMYASLTRETEAIDWYQLSFAFESDGAVALTA
jgi:hypothetical protein